MTEASKSDAPPKKEHGVLYIGMDLGTSRTSVSASNGVRETVYSVVGYPKDVVAKINAEMQRVFKLPDVVDKLKALGLEPWLTTPEELAAYQQKEIAKWAKVIKAGNIKID